MNLTPKQMKIMTRIREVRTTRGYSPTMQELADELGVSKVTVFEHIEALIKKGALRREPNKARSLEIVDEAVLPHEETHVRLPLVGSIAAGSPIEAIEDKEYLDLETVFLPRGVTPNNVFVLRVRGDSMIDDHICDGDHVICQNRNTARSGETVVALLDTGEATLKRLYREKNGQIRLQPANANYEPILVPADEVQIQGTVIGLIRQF